MQSWGHLHIVHMYSVRASSSITGGTVVLGSIIMSCVAEPNGKSLAEYGAPIDVFLVGQQS